MNIGNGCEAKLAGDGSALLRTFDRMPGVTVMAVPRIVTMGQSEMAHD